MNSICCDSNDTRTIYCPPTKAKARAKEVNFESRVQSVNDDSSESLKVKLQLRVHWCLRKILSDIGSYLIRKHNQRVDRQAFNHLLALDESLLKDIGVTRNDVLWASNLPISEDASAKLNEIARRK